MAEDTASEGPMTTRERRVFEGIVGNETDGNGMRLGNSTGAPISFSEDWLDGFLGVRVRITVETIDTPAEPSAPHPAEPTGAKGGEDF